MSYRTNRRTKGKFRVNIVKITDPIDKRLDFLLHANQSSKVSPIDRHQGNAFTLMSWTSQGPEEYSANPHDYFMSKDDHVFEDSEGNEMDLVWMGYNKDGDYVPFATLQEHPITVKDLRRLPIK